MTTPSAPATPLAAEPQDARLRRSVRMRPALWEGLDALARGQGISTNALLEAVAERLAAGSAAAGAGKSPEPLQQPDGVGAYKRVLIRLREADREELRRHAAAMGQTVTGFITAAVRARIRRSPHLANDEVAGLVEANRQLAAVGRNLNTVVHRLHREGRWAGNLDLYAELLASVKRVRARVEAVIRAGQERSEAD